MASNGLERIEYENTILCKWGGSGNLVEYGTLELVSSTKEIKIPTSLKEVTYFAILVYSPKYYGMGVDGVDPIWLDNTERAMTYGGSARGTIYREPSNCNYTVENGTFKINSYAQGINQGGYKYILVGK